MKLWWSIKPTRTICHIRHEWGKMSLWKSSQDVCVWCFHDEWLTLFPKRCSCAAASSLCSSIFIHLTPSLIYWRVGHSRQTLHQTPRRFVHKYKCLHRLHQERYICKIDEDCAFEFQNIQTVVSWNYAYLLNFSDTITGKTNLHSMQQLCFKWIWFHTNDDWLVQF